MVNLPTVLPAYVQETRQLRIGILTFDKGFFRAQEKPVPKRILVSL
jgi:hypothetical protein